MSEPGSPARAQTQLAALASLDPEQLSDCAQCGEPHGNHRAFLCSTCLQGAKPIFKDTIETKMPISVDFFIDLAVRHILEKEVPHPWPLHLLEVSVGPIEARLRLHDGRTFTVWNDAMRRAAEDACRLVLGRGLIGGGR